MKSRPTTLAITAGLLIVLGYMSFQGERMWTAPKILVGLLFGATVTWEWLKNPNRVASKPNLILNTLLFVFLNVWTALTESRVGLVYSLIWTSLYCGVLFAFTKLHHKERGNETAPPMTE